MKNQLENSPVEYVDYLLQIKELPAANRSPISVTRDAELQEAITLMMINDYSQLPVMEGERTVHGYISWRTIGETLAFKHHCERVRDCMKNPAVILTEEEPLLKAVNIIASEDFVLVSNKEKRVIGLVTTSDITLHFHKLAEPFFLISQIESALRRIIDLHFSQEELKKVQTSCDEQRIEKRTVQSAADLTFGEYSRLLGSEANWQRFNNFQISRPIFIRYLDEVREIRNDTMHFRPNGVPDKKIELLRNMTEFLKQLCAIEPK